MAAPVLGGGAIAAVLFGGWVIVHGRAGEGLEEFKRSSFLGAEESLPPQAEFGAGLGLWSSVTVGLGQLLLVEVRRLEKTCCLVLLT